MQKPRLVAVDSNVLILMAERDDLTLDAWHTIKSRLHPTQFIATPTVIRELTHKATRHPVLCEPAANALKEMRSRWRCEPTLLNAVQEVVTTQIIDRLSRSDLLPVEEKHDMAILAEAATLDCTLLITHDSHLRDIDFERLAIFLHEFHVNTPVIATPREVVTKFFR